MISTNDVVGRYTVVGCVFGFHDIAFSWRWAIGETFDSGGGVFGSFSFELSKIHINVTNKKKTLNSNHF